MQTTTPSQKNESPTKRSRPDREAIVRDLEAYRTLLYEPLPAAEVNERQVHARIDALLDRLNSLR